MNVLKSIHLHNFQIHSDLHIDLEQMNVIQGASDKGKSSITRALYWLIFNRPTGADFYRKEGTDEFWVEIIKTDGTRIRRGKEKNEAYYLLNEEKFVAIRSDVPVPVQRALNLDSLNIVGQHESHFLLSDSKPEASRFIFSLIGLEEMDKSLSVAEGRRRKATAQMALIEKDIADLEEDQERLKLVPEMMKRISILEKKQDTLSDIKSDIFRIEQDILYLQEIEVSVKPETDINSLLSSITETVSIAKQRDRLSVLIQNFAQTDTSKVEAILEQAEKQRESLCSLQGTLLTCSKNKNDLTQFLTSFQDNDVDISEQTDVYREYLDTWNNEAGGKCPTCGSTIKKEPIRC